jgi:hypothetical protein
VKRILNNQQRSNESYKRMCRQLQEVGIPAVAPGSPIMKPGCILGHRQGLVGQQVGHLTEMGGVSAGRVEVRFVGVLAIK